MKSIGWSIIENRKQIFSNYGNGINASQLSESLVRWEKNNYKELQITLENWQYIIATFLVDGRFAYGVYQFFKLNFRSQNRYSFRMSDILSYLSNEHNYSLYYTKKVNTCSRKDISIDDLIMFINDSYIGKVVDGRRIFPSLEFPFIDDQYYDHFDWNKKIIGVAISNLFDFQNGKHLLLYSNVHKESKINEMNSCNCRSGRLSYLGSDNNKSICSCNVTSTNRQNVVHSDSHTYLKSVLIGNQEYNDALGKPIVLVGFTGLNSQFYRMEKRDCHCGTLTKGKCGLDPIGIWCAKAKKNPGGQVCSHGNWRCDQVISIDSIM